MKAILTKRPRDLDSWRAAAILYGDWGTSKAYVLGLAFALAGYSSFWFILAVSFLTLLVGTSYIFICKVFPAGGGVYTSVRSRSKVLALLGAFFLFSDYLVTASLSSLSAFHYLGVAHPEYWAIFSIAIIGIVNFLGTKHTGNLAIMLAIPTVLIIIIMGALSIPFLPEAVDKLQPVSDHPLANWGIFVGIIVALSGIESIANTTGSMKLDLGTTEKKPSVSKTSTKAIIMVMLEVCIFTALLGLAMNALPGLQIVGNDVNAPGYPNVRDAMLRYMGDVFGTALFGPLMGQVIAYTVMIVIAFLLLSAVNTALIALISLLFIMSRDEEIPSIFQKLNRFGDPIYATLISFLLPIAILLFVSDIAGLANLYAIGFVGAIAVNLASTATNFKLELKMWQRIFMLVTFVIMAAIEVTLFIDKPHARAFVITIMFLGLLLRALAAERKAETPIPVKLPSLPGVPDHLSGGIMVATTGKGKALDFALEEAQITKVPLHILFVREQRVVTEHDRERTWTEDPLACEVYDQVIAVTDKRPSEFLYVITANPVYSIVEMAQQKKVSRVVLGKKRGVMHLISTFKGTTISHISHHMPKNIDIIVVY